MPVDHPLATPESLYENLYTLKMAENMLLLITISIWDDKSQ